MTELVELSFDAQVLMHYLAKSEEYQSSHMLVLQLIPHGVAQLIMNKMGPDDTHWPRFAEIYGNLLRHYTDDAVSRVAVAMEELLGHGYIDRQPEER